MRSSARQSIRSSARIKKTKAKNKETFEKAGITIDKTNKTKTATPRGVTVYAGGLVLSETQNTIDEALTELFEDARALGYTQKLDHSLYTITIKEDCIDRSGTMSWLVNAPNYNNTEYDQNPDPSIGQVYAAEQVLFGLNGEPSMEYVICRGSKELMANTTRFGAEHIILFYNDFAKYKETATHLDGAGHPIIPHKKV